MFMHDSIIHKTNFGCQRFFSTYNKKENLSLNVFPVIPKPISICALLQKIVKIPPSLYYNNDSVKFMIMEECH